MGSAGIEPTAYRLGGDRSILLSYDPKVVFIRPILSPEPLMMPILFIVTKGKIRRQTRVFGGGIRAENQVLKTHISVTQLKHLTDNIPNILHNIAIPISIEHFSCHAEHIVIATSSTEHLSDTTGI